MGPSLADSRQGLRGWTGRALLLLAALWLGATLLAASPQQASGRGCDRIASPDGHDHWRGSVKRPYRTLQRLANRLRPGQVGCLRGGTYRGNVKFRRHGTRKRRIAIRPYGHERARVRGELWVSRRAGFVTVKGLWLNGANRHHRPSPVINAPGVRFQGNDVTNDHTAICFALGSGSYGAANGAAIVRNRIHGCGRLPRTNFDHGVYVAVARGARIEGNWIYDNADYGVHLYPDSQGTRVLRNVIYANGEGLTFAGDGGIASNGNIVERNVIAGSLARSDVESHWPDGSPVGIDNVVRSNCVGPRVGDRGGILPGALGFSVVGTLFGLPEFLDLGRHDFRLTPRSSCAGLLGSLNSQPGPPQRQPRRKSRS